MATLRILLLTIISRFVVDFLSIRKVTRKMVPITGQASSLLEIFCMYDKKFEISKTK